MGYLNLNKHFSRLSIQNESSINTRLQFTLGTLKSYIKELENKIEIFRVENQHKINYDDKLKVILIIY